ncbi:MAG: amidohydrolase family protein [Acidimicrobiales bacterium]|nr:amidohydrolase family protein [Acidimicrobiales bacterium]
MALEAARAYNDWQADTFLRTSPRYIGAAMIPMVDVGDAIGEVERAADLGYPATLLPATPPVPYNDEIYEPLWALLAETGMHPCLHIGTGMDPMVTRGQGGAIINYVETLFPLQRAALHLVAAGVFDRHPGLHLVCVEGGASWLPGLLERMDEAARSHADWVKPKLSRPPSEIIRTNVHATFQSDKSILLTLDVTGVSSLMWGSDYPHLEGTWPRTQQILDEIFVESDPEISGTDHRRHHGRAVRHRGAGVMAKAASCSDAVLNCRLVGSVLHVTMGRAPVNAVDGPFYAELRDTFASVERDWPEANAVVLTSSVRHFCAGNDLDEFRTMTSANARARMFGVREAFFAIARLRRAGRCCSSRRRPGHRPRHRCILRRGGGVRRGIIRTS